jgi:Fe-S cluster assembly protein SufD
MTKIQIDLTKPENIIEVEDDCEIVGLFIGKGDANIKTSLKIIHRKPHLTSRVNIKAIVFDKARFDLEGMLRIEKGAVDTDTYLKIDCLVMSDNAYARAVPSLEILESEVKGGHGATIGYLDPEMLYYIKSRGLSQKRSEETLVAAFIANS